MPRSSNRSGKQIGTASSTGSKQLGLGQDHQVKPQVPLTHKHCPVTIIPLSLHLAKDFRI